MNEGTITKKDADFFIEMTSNFDPISGENKYFNRNNYYKILDKRESEDFQRFIRIYNAIKHILKERQRQILDELYGVYKPRMTLKKVGEIHGVRSSRIRRIRVDAERDLKRYVRRLPKKQN